MDDKLEWWQDTPEAKGFKFSKLKTENLKCEFSGEEGANEDEV